MNGLAAGFEPIYFFLKLAPCLRAVKDKLVFAAMIHHKDTKTPRFTKKKTNGVPGRVLNSPRMRP